jgi:hypothetical protein
MENVKLQFCGYANKVEGKKGDFWSVDINREQLAGIITEFQSSNPFIDLCINEKKEHKPDERFTHYVYSHPRYQAGEPKNSIATIRLYKNDLEKIPNKYKNYSVTMVANTDKEAKNQKSDFSLYVKQDDKEYPVGVGFKPQEKVELLLCGNLLEQTGEKGEVYYTASFEKEKLNELKSNIFKDKDFIDLSVAENKNHEPGEISSHYVYSNLRYQNTKDQNPRHIMNLRLYKKDLDTLPANEFPKIFAMVAPVNKEKQRQEDYTVYVKPDKEAKPIYIGHGYNQEELRIGSPVHFKCANPVLESFIGEKIQAAFGVIEKIENKTDYIVDSPAGMFKLHKDDLKPASKDDLRGFEDQYREMENQYNTNKNKDKKVKNSKVNEVKITDGTSKSTERPNEGKEMSKKYDTKKNSKSNLLL